jgi:uncharacterized protein (UPF0212 family)
MDKLTLKSGKDRCPNCGEPTTSACSIIGEGPEAIRCPNCCDHPKPHFMTIKFGEGDE